MTVKATANSIIRQNVSASPATCNASNGNLPTGLSTLTGGSSYYFNVQVSSDLYVKNAKLYIKTPGSSSYSLIHDESASGYMRYTSKRVAVPNNQPGTLSYYWRLTYTNGSTKTLSTASVTVKATATPSHNMSFVVINQNDYSTIDYSKPSGAKATVKSGGCGVCAMANTILYITGKDYNRYNLVADIAQKNKASGARGEGGTSISDMISDTKLQEKYHFKDSGYVEKDNFKKYINKNSAILICVSNTCFNSYSGCHIVSLVGYDSNSDKVLCLDSHIDGNHRYTNNNEPFWIPVSSLDCNGGYIVTF